MKLRRNKKGFTIIELVIVIAVIGILAAVLIPTFVNLTNKANEASDNALVNNLNKALKMEEQEPGHKKAETLEGAILDLEHQGYLLENLVSKSGKDLLWSQSENQFLLNTENKSGEDYWKIVDAVPEKANQKYSYYAGKNFNQTDVTVAYGFDAGRNDGITKVTYEGTGSTQKVAIRTSSANTTVTIDASTDTVHHYGAAGSVDIKAIYTDSYHENGTVQFLAIKEGRVVLEVKSNVDTLYFTKTNTSFANIVVKAQEGVTLPEFKRDSIGVAIGDELIKVCKVETSASQETIYLKGNGTIEDAQVFVSTTGSKDDAVAVTESTASTAAKEIANAKVGGNVEDKGMSEAQKEETIKEKKEAALDVELFNAGYFLRIGSKGYNSIHEAVAEAAVGETIKLLTDYDMEEKEPGYGYGAFDDPSGHKRNNMIQFNKDNVTFDLGGHSITNLFNNTFNPCANNITFKNGELRLGYLYKKTAQGELELGSYVMMTDGANNLKIENMSTFGGINVSGGSAIISDMSFTGLKFYSVCSQNGANVTINGGSYNKAYEGSGNAVFWVESQSSMTINGGNFVKLSTVPFHLSSGIKPIVNGGTFNFDPTTYVDSNTHSVVDNGDGTWTVVTIN